MGDRADHDEAVTAGGAKAVKTAPTFTLGRSFSIDQDGAGVPFDTIGAVGEDVIVVVLNGKYYVFDKDGVELVNDDLNSLFGDIEESPGGTFDPRIVYDPAEQRFYATACDGRADGAGSQLLIAVSKTGNPATGGWDAFAVDTGYDVEGDEQRWPDFAMLGFNSTVVTVSLKLVGKDGAPQHLSNAVYMFPKSDLLAETPTIENMVEDDDIDLTATPGVWRSHPQVDLDNDELPHTLWQWGKDFAAPDRWIKRWDVTDDGGLSVDEIIEIPYALGSGNHGPQPDGATPLDHSQNAQIGSNPVKSGGFVYLALPATNGINVIKIDYATNVIVAQKLLFVPGLTFIYPSIAVNSFGQIVVGCTATGTEQYASAAVFVGRDYGAQLIFGSIVYTQEGERIYETGSDPNRWGDYSATVADPVNLDRFWTFQTWAWDNGSNNLGRKIEVTEIIMTDNITLPGTGEVIASDKISGAKYQRVKISVGADGAADDCSAAKPLPVVLQDPTDSSRQAHLDNIHLAPVVTDITHHQVHEGESFECEAHDIDMGSADTIVLAFKTPSGPKQIHLAVAYASKADAHVDLLEAPTWTASSGTQKTIFNRFRDSAEASVVLEDKGTGSFVASDNMIQDPDSLAGGEIVDSSYNWSDRKTTFSDRGDSEFVLKVNTQYAVRLTADAGTNAGQIKLSWYEHPPE